MKILVVEDDPVVREAMVETLTQAGKQVAWADTAEGARSQLPDTNLLITDLQLPGMNGMELLREARTNYPGLPVIVVTGHSSISSAVEAMRLGARSYIAKPFDPEELLFHAREVEETFKLRERAARAGRGGLVGTSQALQSAYLAIDEASVSDAPVLISGNTGTGKELAARAIHDLSPRKNSPFVAVNIGAFPKELLENELFGHVKGAFSGANTRRRGRFMVASGGSLFLDEIDSIPLELQPKILRAIENSEIWPLGAEKPENADTRIIAATNSDLGSMVANGNFREDLYYRLNVLRVMMPTLRKRPEDIPIIVWTLLNRISDRAKSKKHPQLEIDAQALSALTSAEWKGNVRELNNALERAAAKAMSQDRAEGRISDSVRMTLEHFEGMATDFPELPFKDAKARASEEWSKRVIREALVKTTGNVAEASRNLKMSRTALIRLINRYQIEVNRD